MISLHNLVSSKRANPLGPSPFSFALRFSSAVFFPHRLELLSSMKKMVDWSHVARKEGLLGLESISEEEPDLFLRKGMQLLVDGTEPEAIREILELDPVEEMDGKEIKEFF